MQIEIPLKENIKKFVAINIFNDVSTFLAKYSKIAKFEPTLEIAPKIIHILYVSYHCLLKSVDMIVCENKRL